MLRGKAPLRVRIESNKRLLLGLGVGISCVLLYTGYQAWYSADADDTPDHDEHEDEKVAAQPQA